MSNQQADITYVICQTTSAMSEVSVWWQVSRPLTNTWDVVVTASAGASSAGCRRRSVERDDHGTVLDGFPSKESS